MLTDVGFMLHRRTQQMASFSGCWASFELLLWSVCWSSTTQERQCAAWNSSGTVSSFRCQMRAQTWGTRRLGSKDGATHVTSIALRKQRIAVVVTSSQKPVRSFRARKLRVIGSV